MEDKITIDRIKEAHPRLRDKMLQDYKKANSLLGKGVRLRFAYVFRSNSLQDKLYNQRPKVTNAKGGQSIHNYGLAFDIVLLYDNDGNGTFEEASYSQIKDFDKDAIADWKEVTDYFKSQGWECGADWKTFKDAPHFEYNYGFDWKTLKARVDRGIIITDNGITYPKI
jgi:peptidoglycan L-alanyl-D-glutamate endopeptidase CwlK